MKNSSKTRFPYVQFDRFCVRTPLLPIEFFKDLTSGEEIHDEVLMEKMEISMVQEAIFLASPDFYFQVIKWCNGDIKDVVKARRVKLSLLKYLTRMATRCTPFGLFAGCATGTFSTESQLELLPPNESKRQTRYDMHFLVAFSNYLAEKEHIKHQLVFFPNSTLYKIGNRYRYVEYTYIEKRRQHSLESISYSNYLEDILKSAKNGITLRELTSILTNLKVKRKEAIDFINQLIVNQILISDFEPSVTGPDFLEQLYFKVSKLENISEELQLIDRMRSFLERLDQNIGNSTGTYLEIKEVIKSLEVPFELKFLFQTDVFTSFKTKHLSYGTLKKIKQGIAFLNKISRPSKNDNIERFKTAFNQRFEHQRVALLKLIDVESGIGYVQDATRLEATPFLDDIVYEKNNSPNEAYQINWSSFRSVLLEKLAYSLSNDLTTIELYDSDFPDFEYDWEDAPDSVSGMIEVIVEKGQEKIVIDYCGPGAAMLLGRFCYGEKGLMDLVNEIVAREKELQPDKILAEIVHLPESRTGNILRRPNLRTHEITCLGKSNLPLENQIPLEDILVCVENDTIKLFSKKLAKEIVPRLTNAHNYSANALPVYHFLCDLQYQNQRKYSFSWGNLLKEFKYLPRLTYKDIILSRALWNLEKKDIEELVKISKSEALSLEKIKSWREVIKLPKLAQWADGDNTLVVDFENLSSVKMFLEAIKNRFYFQLEEFLFDKDCLIKRENQSYCNQFVMAFVKAKPKN